MNFSYQIIYINGASSSGKTTLAKALQQELDEPFLHVSLDKVIGMMPEKVNNWEGGFAPDGFSWKEAYDETGNHLQELQMGPFAKKIVNSFKEIVLTLAKNGHYLIIDDISFGKTEVDEWRKLLKDYNVLWIGLSIPLALLEEREKKRGNRIIGSARAQYSKVHKDVIYDIEFEMSQITLDDTIKIFKKNFC